MEAVPVFDFANPWVAIIQIALIYLLPRLTGLVTDKLTASRVKIAVLGALTVLASALTWLLDVAIAQGWATLDWTALINVIANAAIVFFLAQGVYTGIIKPLGQADRDARSTAIQVIGRDA
jgi:predicted Na+-dependent transporter